MLEGRINATLSEEEITSESIVRASMVREVADARVAV